MLNRFPVFRGHGRAACAGLLGAAALTLGLMTPASAQSLGVVQWQDYQTKFCLYIVGADAYATRCSVTGTAGEWEIWAGSYDYTFQNEYTNDCLDSNYSNPANPAVGAVYNSPCDGADTYQNWTPGGEGPALTIQDYQTGLCLDSNLNVYTDACNWNDTYQNWTPLES